MKLKLFSVVFLAAILLQSCSSSNNADSAGIADCGSDHPAVGSEAEFSMLEHGVSGTLNVIDNCTLQITNFNYDGLGPDVFFFAGVSQDFVSPGYFQFDRRLNGTVFNNATIILELPEDKTLDDFNSLSVWCIRFGVSFGDAFWGDAPL